MLKILSKTLKRTAVIINKLANKIERSKIPENLFSESVQAVRVKPWFNENGDKTHRLNYELNTESVVFDLGGYEGEWASQIFCLYGATVYIFEPYEVYFEKLKNRFRYNEKVKIFQCGLSKNSDTAQLAIADNGSSIFLKNDNMVSIKLVRASDFFRMHNIPSIDLMKINIEGGEYDLLEHLIETGDVTKIRNIQVQFHDFVENAESRMVNIQSALNKTHGLTYQYKFVWENWRLKGTFLR